MARFTLYWVNGENPTAVEGDDISDACEALNEAERRNLHSYQMDGGERIPVAGQINCGCWYSAGDGIACKHDLEAVGL